MAFHLVSRKNHVLTLGRATRLKPYLTASWWVQHAAINLLVVQVKLLTAIVIKWQSETEEVREVAGREGGVNWCFSSLQHGRL